MKKWLLASLAILPVAGILVIGGVPVLAQEDAMTGDNMMEGDNMMAAYTFADITKAVVITDSSEFEKIRVSVGADVPTDGTGGAFGYGVISSAGLEAIIVTTTHAGVKDSIAQVDAADPSFHNHYVALEDLADDATCPGLQVRDISYQEPGDVDVYGNSIVVEDAPYYFGATHSLSGDNISFNADDMAGTVVSFTINPVDAEGNTSVTDIAAVCINDVMAVDDPLIIPASYWED